MVRLVINNKALPPPPPLPMPYSSYAYIGRAQLGSFNVKRQILLGPCCPFFFFFVEGGTTVRWRGSCAHVT